MFRSIIVFAAITFMFPGVINFVDFRGTVSTLTIKINRYSPAFSAHLDTQTDVYDFSKEEKDLQIAMLMTAAETLETTNEERDLSYYIEKEVIEVPPVHKVNVPALVIRQNKKIKPMKVVEAPQPQIEIPVQTIAAVNEPAVPKGYTIVKAEQEAIVQYHQKQDWSEKSVHDEAQRLINNQLLATDPNNTDEQRVIPTASGASIIVAKPNKEPPAKVHKKSKKQKPSKAAHGHGDSKNNLAKNLPQLPDLGRHISNGGRNGRGGHTPSRFEPSYPDLYEVRGDLALHGGLGADGDAFDLVVYHIQDGFIQREAIVFFKEARFEISVTQLEGYLVGEVRNRAGELVGLGELNLYDLPDHMRHQAKITGMNLRLSPAPKGVQVDLISARSFGNHRFQMKEAQLSINDLERRILPDDEGLFVDEGLVPSSSFQLKAVQSNHWGTLALGVSGESTEVKLFPQSMVEALLETTLNRYDAIEAKDQGVIWGRVVVDGRPVEGAEVELAGWESQPVYFNSFLPDQNLTATTKNGLFAFVNVPPGLVAVRAKYQGVWLPAELVSVQKQFVSHVAIHSLKPKSVEVKSYDGISGEPLPTSFSVLGTENDIEIGVSGESLIHLPGGKGVMYVESDAGEEYALSRHTIHRRSKFIDLPLVKGAWIEKISTDKRVNLSPDLGVIVGFVQKSDFEVLLGAGSEDSDPNIVYFDSDGKVFIRGSKDQARGLAGGGFIIFNVEPGVQTLTLLPAKGRKIHTQVVAVEPNVVSTTTVSLH